MTGVFVSSNVCTFWPRFIVQNSYHFDIRILPLVGSRHLVESVLKGIAEGTNSRHDSQFITLKTSESCVIYSFAPVAKFESIHKGDLNDR